MASATGTPVSGRPGSPVDVTRIAVLLGTFAVTMAFALVTHHVSDDFLIAYRYSVNLATHHGLVYVPGARVQGFTSPLGVLIPAAIVWLLGSTSVENVLAYLRVINGLFLSGAAVCLLQIGRTHLRSRGAVALLIGLFVTETTVLDYSINGMESAYVVFFTALTAYALAAHRPRSASLLGAAWAGLLWSRPDGVIVILALTLAFAAIMARERRQILVQALAASIVTACLYTPWLLWTWWYYGSPIPHSVIAKASSWGQVWRTLGFQPLGFVPDRPTLQSLLTPPYSVSYGWPVLFDIYGYALGLLAVSWWLSRGRRAPGRAWSLATLFACIYLNVVPSFPWYYCSAAVLAMLALAHATDELLEMGRTVRALVRPILAAVLVAQTLLLVLTGIHLRIVQSHLEDRHRKVIGTWLAEHGSPGDSVFTESLGYFGYYSGMRVLDYPGIVSPAVVAARREGDSFAHVIAATRPDWLVIRPGEAARIQSEKPGLLGHDYRLERVFDQRPDLARLSFAPSRYALHFDSIYLVYHRSSLAERIPDAGP
jgi:hypothetical protein